MAIKYIKRLFVGVSAAPIQQLLIDTDNTLAEVLASGYLSSNAPDFQFNNKQIASVYTTDGGMGVYQVTVSGATVSLAANTDGVVTTPVVSGNFPKFSGATGLMVDSGISPSNAAKTKAMMANAAMVADNLISAADTAGTGKDSGVATNRVMQSAFNSPDIEANLVPFDIAVTAAALASGAVTLYTSSGSKQYKIRELWINSGGTNFSGGGGDKDLAITDGTTVYSVIPDTALAAVANAGWGDTDLPYPAAAAINTSSVAGQSIRAQYTGGTTNYSAGSVVISGILQRVA